MTAGTGTSLGPNASMLIVSTINTLTVGFLAPAFEGNASSYSNRLWRFQIVENYNTFCRKGDKLQSMHSVGYNRANVVI